MGTVFADMKTGVKFIFSRTATLTFTILSMGAGLFAIRCFSALIAVYVRDILHAQTGLFGTVSVLVGVGMIIGTQFVTRLSKTMSKEKLMMGGLFLVAVGILLLAVFGNVPVTITATLVMGFGVALVVISAQTLMQGQTPIDMLGRVTSTLMSVLSFAQVAGLVLSGSIAQLVGIRNSYIRNVRPAASDHRRRLAHRPPPWNTRFLGASGQHRINPRFLAYWSCSDFFPPPAG